VSRCDSSEWPALRAYPCHTPGMADPICAVCVKPILPTEHKVIVNGAPYHGHCWDRKEKERGRGTGVA